ncbi:MAG TPA: DUF2852 domain-containing protein [Hyphomicrobiaceae bacterium]|nr:DUF2852 domain-containing protein [Hyphomicrobiaceae bacterium]
MRKHVLMWWLAGGATLLGASLTYLATRPAVAPVVARAQAGAVRLRESKLWENGVWAAKKLGDRLGAKIGGLLRKDSAVNGSREKPIVRNSAFEEYRTAELARLEEEERAFHDYLERLRTARDREEFEAFMQDRRTR